MICFVCSDNSLQTETVMLLLKSKKKLSLVAFVAQREICIRKSPVEISQPEKLTLILVLLSALVSGAGFVSSEVGEPKLPSSHNVHCLVGENERGKRNKQPNSSLWQCPYSGVHPKKLPQRIVENVARMRKLPASPHHALHTICGATRLWFDPFAQPGN